MSIRENNRPRRDFILGLFKGSTALGMAGLGIGQSTAGQEKIPQRAIAYQESPKNGQNCSECLYWEGKGHCSKVQGEISPEGWCALFVPS